jgi:hypothetical protein
VGGGGGAGSRGMRGGGDSGVLVQQFAPRGRGGGGGAGSKRAGTVRERVGP